MVSRDSESTPASPARRFAIACLWGLAIAGSAWLRWRCAQGDFWLDEIVTWTDVAKFRSAAEVLDYHSETNHYLSSWIIYWLGPDKHWTTYRLPAVIAGVLSVVMAGVIGRRRGTAEMCLSLLLASTSYLLVHYSSEARGYAYAIFFALASYALCDSALRGGSPVTCLAFAACAILGFLAQLTFVPCYAALVIWSAWRLARDPLSLRWRARVAILCHAPPIAFFVWLYVAHIRYMRNVGGPILSVVDVVVETLSLTLGGPFSGPWAIALAVAGAAILVAGLVLHARTRSDAWIFFLGAIAIFPALTLIVLGREEIYVRYFLIGATLLLLLLADLLAALWRRGVCAKFGCCVLLTAYLAGNARHIERLIDVGRGNYVAALELMQRESSGPLVIGSDHDGRNWRILDFYSTKLSGMPPILYFPTGEWPAEGPDWVIRHSLEQQPRFEPEIGDRNGNRYRLEQESGFAGLSGWSWAVYRNERLDTVKP